MPDDDAGFAELAAPLLLYVRQWLPRADAEDVVQESLVRLLERRRPPRDVRPWLFRVARNAARAHRRSAARRARRDRAAQQCFEATAVDLLDAGVIDRALSALPEEEREVLVLRTWADLTLAQVSTVTGLSVASVFRRHRAALAHLRSALQEDAHVRSTRH